MTISVYWKAGLVTIVLSRQARQGQEFTDLIKLTPLEIFAINVFLL